jgi:hypothetical protein
MQNTASDLSARLLATENLSVVRAKAPTASFNIKSRVLTLPLWKDMTPEIEDMLIGHEVGHALWTGEAYLEPIKETPKLMTYMNVLEDVRIEKMMKRKYPGIRKRMNEGYKQLNERDFFGVKSIQDFNELLLIDRINLYFKVGFDCGVTFTPVEKAFVNRAERTETMEEIVALAQEIFAYSKEQAEKRKQERMELGLDSEEDEDEDDEPMQGDFDIDDLDDFDLEEDEDAGDDKKTSKGGSSKENQDAASDDVKDEDLEAKTDKVFQQRLEELADDSTEYLYWKFDTKYYEDPVVGYKTILNETKSIHDWNADLYQQQDYKTRYMDDAQRREFFGTFTREYDQFKTDSMRTVNYLVKEFEMKKSAQILKRAQVSKSGSLSMGKVWAYKLQDDLFKRVTVLPQGKNHGMVMLLDWSGSMDAVLQDTLKQVINLAMFCQRIQVPYRVYAFSTDYEKDLSYDERNLRHQKMRDFYSSLGDRTSLLSNTRGFHLLEFFNDKMSSSEFNEMSRRLLDYRFRWNDGYSTSGTPLNEALAWCYLNLGEFIKRNNLEKTTFITLTDGEGGQLHGDGRRLESVRNDYIDGKYTRTKLRHFIRDDVTKKTYELNNHSATQTETILRMIKDRHNVNTVGFYICRNHRRDLQSVIGANLPGYTGSTEVLIENWRKQFRDQSFASVKNTGRDELFLIPQSSTKIEEGELDVKSDAKAASIARNFSKYLNVKKTSRVLLNRFVALVA